SSLSFLATPIIPTTRIAAVLSLPIADQGKDMYRSGFPPVLCHHVKGREFSRERQYSDSRRACALRFFPPIHLCGAAREKDGERQLAVANSETFDTTIIDAIHAGFCTFHHYPGLAATSSDAV
ncbi:hypothetical protein ALC56_12023, partial [Trachymyrmex septentrionalis]